MDRLACPYVSGKALLISYVFWTVKDLGPITTQAPYATFTRNTTPCAAFIIVQSRAKIQKIKGAHEIKHYN